MAGGEAQLERIARLAGDLPGVERSTSYGDPALKVGGKMFACVKDDRTLVLYAPIEAKSLLLEIAPEIYYETDHYIGWPSVLVRLDVIGDEELKLRLLDAWTERAPEKLRRQRPTPGSA